MEKRKQIGLKHAQAMKERVAKGMSFEEAAQAESLAVKRPEPFTLSSYIPEVGRDTKFLGTAFSLKPREVSDPVEGVRGYYLITLVDKTPFNEADFQAQKQSIKEQLLERKRSSAFSNWYSQLKERAKIKDYRDLYF